MIAVDTSTLIAFHAGESGVDITYFTDSLQGGIVVLPPTVLAEMLSDSLLPREIEKHLLRIPLLDLTEGYWERVGRLRRTIMGKKFKARLADAQIAQSCVDARVSLITRDKYFKKFGDYSNLNLILGP